MQKHWLAALILLPILGCNSAPSSSTLSGSVWVDSGTGEAIALRGVTVHLCHGEHTNLFRAIPVAGATEAEKRAGMSRNLNNLNSFASDNLCPYETITDADGNYSLTANPGDYIIVATQQSSQLLAGWTLPITLTNSTQIDLSDDNASVLAQ